MLRGCFENHTLRCRPTGPPSSAPAAERCRSARELHRMVAAEAEHAAQAASGAAARHPAPVETAGRQLACEAPERRAARSQVVVLPQSLQELRADVAVGPSKGAWDKSGRPHQGGKTWSADVGSGSIRARRAKEDLSFAGRGRAVEARWSADPHIADTHGGTGCRAGCRFDGADPTYAQRRRPAPCRCHAEAQGKHCACAHQKTLSESLPPPRMAGYVLGGWWMFQVTSRPAAANGSHPRIRWPS
jgi:hypothetical protein